MNDFSELEAELKRLRPVAPSPELIARVERALAVEAEPTLVRPARFRMNWSALGLGLAAAAALVLLARVGIDREAKPEISIAAQQFPQPVLEQTPPTLQPDGMTRVVYQTSDEGLVFPPNSPEPLRRVRSRSREILRWKNPSTGASLRVSYPTEDVELIPVSGQ